MSANKKGYNQGRRHKSPYRFKGTTSRHGNSYGDNEGKGAEGTANTKTSAGHGDGYGSNQVQGARGSSRDTVTPGATAHSATAQTTTVHSSDARRGNRYDKRRGKGSRRGHRNSNGPSRRHGSSLGNSFHAGTAKASGNVPKWSSSFSSSSSFLPSFAFPFPPDVGEDLGKLDGRMIQSLVSLLDSDFATSASA
jgi:hypothetical protein